MTNGGMLNFIPEVWEARLEYFLQATNLFGDIVNTDYEGQINGLGDVVRVNTFTDISVEDYVDDTDIVPQALNSMQSTFSIDQAKVWSTYVKAIDQAQLPANYIDEAMLGASYNLKRGINSFILGKYTLAGMTYPGGDITITTANINAFFAKLGRIFDEANLPDVGRWVTIPAWLYEKMVLAKLFVATDNTSTLNNGTVGTYLGWTLKRTNDCVITSTTKNHILAGWGRKAISYAFKMVETSEWELPLQFKRGIKGLCIYGAKVMRPDYLLTATLIEGSEA